MTTIIVTGATLHEAAAWASKVVPPKPVTAVLGGLLLDARDDELVVTASDYETWATVTVPATVKEPGRLLLSARLLTDVAKQVNRDVDFVLDDSSGEVMARCGRSEWSLPPLPAEDFPSSPAALPTVAEVDAAEFRRAVARVLPAVSSDPTTPQLASVRLEPCDAGLALVATDRYRLHVAEVPIVSGEVPELLLVPPELLKAAAVHGGDDTLALTAKGGLFGVSSDEFRLSGRQIEASLPPWRQLLWTLTDHRVVVEAAELRRVVDHVQVMAGSGDANFVDLRFDGDSVEASADLTDRRARAEGTCDARGEAIEVRLTPGYLLDALAALPSTHAAVYVEKSKCLLLPCSATGEVAAGFSALVMGRKRPVR